MMMNPLSPSELNVVMLVAAGWMNKEIAAFLRRSVRTVEFHRRSAMRKLNCRCSADLTRWVIANELL